MGRNVHYLFRPQQPAYDEVEEAPRTNDILVFVVWTIVIGAVGLALLLTNTDNGVLEALG